MYVCSLVYVLVCVCAWMCAHSLVCGCVFQLNYKQTEQLKENTYGTLTDTPELLHAAYLKDVYSQVRRLSLFRPPPYSMLPLVDIY